MCESTTENSPNKCTIFPVLVTFTYNYNAQLFLEMTEPFKKMKSEFKWMGKVVLDFWTQLYLLLLLKMLVLEFS